jgi:hypothetical protein
MAHGLTPSDPSTLPRASNRPPDCTENFRPYRVTPSGAPGRKISGLWASGNLQSCCEGRGRGLPLVVMGTAQAIGGKMQPAHVLQRFCHRDCAAARACVDRVS